MGARYRQKLGPVFSEGARQFWLALRREQCTIQDAYKRLRMSASGRISRWLYGDQQPRADACAQIERVFGVPAGLWGRAPKRPFMPPERGYGARMPATPRSPRARTGAAKPSTRPVRTKRVATKSTDSRAMRSHARAAESKEAA